MAKKIIIDPVTRIEGHLRIMAKEENVPKKSIRIAKKHRSVAMCINHWAMAISIVILIITGFYIAEPFTV